MEKGVEAKAGIKSCKRGQQREQCSALNYELLSGHLLIPEHSDQGLKS